MTTHADPDVADHLRGLIRDVPDFPEPGIVFKDITPVLADPAGFRASTDAVLALFDGVEVDKVAAVDARGFIFGAPVAQALDVGLVPVRKRGKLPWTTHAHEYELEYGTDAIEVHTDAFAEGDRVLIVDDLLATGGTAAATVELVEHFGARVAGLAFLVELTFLPGRDRLAPHEVRAVIDY